MKICRKCGKEFPKWGVVNGKKRIFTSRKFCFECSPFGLHNTKKIDKTESPSSDTIKTCEKCGKRMLSSQKKGLTCFNCSFHKRKQEKVQKVQSIVGTSCLICGYNKLWKNLCFHHVNPHEKTTPLSIREIVGSSWDTILKEMRKCILVCHICHGEIHEGMINEERVKQAHFDLWKGR